MQILQDYHALHAVPETDRLLPKTLAYIQSRLAGLRCDTFSPDGEALCAFFHFGAPHTLAFRADMDAVLLAEGPVHACGHDGHTAMLLELARWLDRETTLPHNVLLLFQPAEETGGGARRLCDSGVLANHSVCAVFGLHLWPKLPFGAIYSRDGPLMSSSCEIRVCFTGKSSHIAYPEQGRDALAAACRFYHRVQGLHLQDTGLLKFGQLTAGTAPNVICDRAVLAGSMRTFDEKVRKKLTRQLTGICKSAAYFTGCRGEIRFSEGYPAVVNSSVLYHRVNTLYPLKKLKKPVMTADDFSCYQQHVPGLYGLLGLGDVPPLHSPDFAFDPAVLLQGAEYYKTLCWEFPFSESPMGACENKKTGV